MYDDVFLSGLAAALRPRFSHWGFGPHATLRLLAVSENANFCAEEAERRLVIRVYRPGYHTRAEIKSELAWIAALTAELGVPTAALVPGEDGSPLCRFTHAGSERCAAGFTFLP